ncbi:hypothetical protein V3I01_09840 [Sphingomonas sp. gentR]|uniref:hypothetical protein n=1 Tax=Sphingomonas sp. gentR TaxID=3118768 RepID=UPI0030CDBE04
MSNLKGARATRSLLRRLPDASQTEIIGAFERGGPRLRAAIQARAKRKTGTLAAGVKFRIYPKTLRMQVGLLGTKRGRAKLFYGFVLDKGRKAQVVTVQRRRVGSGKVLSRGRKRAQDIVSILCAPARPGAAMVSAGRATPTLTGSPSTASTRRWWTSGLSATRTAAPTRSPPSFLVSSRSTRT